MTTTNVQVFDPPICCSSGGCGPGVDPKLARVSSDLDWLRKQGVEVERYNLSSHPAAFAEQESVKQALENEGAGCLPLIVVNGSIVHKRDYPSRAELARLFSLVSKTGEIADLSNSRLPVEPANEAAACGPGCNCGVPSSARKARVAISLVVLLAFAGIATYKALSGTRQDGSTSLAGRQAGFTIAAAAQNAAPEKEPPSQDRVAPKKIQGMPEPRNSVTLADEKTAPSAEDALRIGSYIESMSELNKVAMGQDAVFIFVPSKTEGAASEPTRTAVLAAQKNLDPKEFKVGLYTLQPASSDYPAISSQVQVPAVLVLRKGRGMGAVSGEVTETKLLQAFVSASRGGGCCPSGSGASRCK